MKLKFLKLFTLLQDLFVKWRLEILSKNGNYFTYRCDKVLKILKLENFEELVIENETFIQEFCWSNNSKFISFSYFEENRKK